MKRRAFLAATGIDNYEGDYDASTDFVDLHVFGQYGSEMDEEVKKWYNDHFA